MEKEIAVLLCAPANSPVTLPGSVFNRHCRKCLTRVQISPSGQQQLKQNPAMTIVCMRCLPPGPIKFRWSSGSFEAAMNEAVQMIPNTWRDRN